MPVSPQEILVVENHADTLKYVCKFLRLRGYEVREAVDMESALREFRAKAPDILLSDIGLPDGDGWELLTVLRAEGHAPYAISMSGFGTGANEQRSIDAGFAHHLMKPFSFDDLVRLLDKAV